MSFMIILFNFVRNCKVGRVSPHWNVFGIFSRLHQSYGFRGCTPQVICHFWHLPSSVYTITMIYVCWCWPWSSEMSGSLTIDLPFTVDLFSILSTLYFEESHYTQPTFKEWVAMLPLIRAACYTIYL